jgi:hypothetical protein
LVLRLPASFGSSLFECHEAKDPKFRTESFMLLWRCFPARDTTASAHVKSGFSTINRRLELLDQVSQRDVSEVVLPKILSLFGDTATYSPELVRLIGVAFLEVRGKVEDVCREQLSPLFSFIADYLKANIKVGRVRNLNSGDLKYCNCCDDRCAAGALEVRRRAPRLTAG